MGTNYYAKLNICPHCGRAEEEIHLGKSSFGWKFTFQYNGGRYYKNIEEMMEWTKDKRIFNEDDEEISYEEFWGIIKEKQNNKSNMSHYDYCLEEGYDMSNKIDIDGYSFSDYEFS